TVSNLEPVRPMPNITLSKVIISSWHFSSSLMNGFD
ncbi:MAG: hypothetical protein ACI965_001260, partial [Paraglaciecola sp.]